MTSAERNNMESNFWRYYRLVLSQRWWILALVAVAGAVILVGSAIQGQRQEHQAVALIEPQTAELRNVIGVSSDSAKGQERNQREEDNDRISNLIVLLRSSNDLYLRAAKLLRMNETDRARETSRILENNGFFAPIFNDIDTQARQRVQSGELAESKVDEWKKENRKKVMEQLIRSFAHGEDSRGQFATGGVALSEDEIAEKIRTSLRFETVDGPLSKEDSRQITNQIRITGTFERAAEAELYVNAITLAFIDFYTSKSTGVLNAHISQIEKLRDKASTERDAARQELATFQKAKGVSLTTAQEAALASLFKTQQQRDEAKQLLEQANGQVGTLETALTNARTSPTLSVKLPTEEDPMLKEYERRYLEAKTTFDRIQNSNYGPGSDEYKTAEKTYNDALKDYQDRKKRPFVATQVNTTIYQLQGQLTDAKSKRDGLQKQLAELERQVSARQADVDQLPTLGAKLADLKQRTARAEENFNRLDDEYQRLKLQVVGSSGAGVISIVSQAHVIPDDTNPTMQKAKLLAYGVILALIFGIALVIGLDALDNSIQTTRDAEKLMGLPVVGVIPAQLPDPARAARITYLDPLSPIAESYRLLRTELLFTFDERFQANGTHVQSLMAATGKPGQGATTTVSNLAITLAQNGKRVILVDADLRYPKLHRYFNISNGIGLSSVLEDRATLEDALQYTNVENLQVLPAGPVPLHPSELLASHRMRLLHQQLKEHADYVLFDTPSAIVFSDASILASILDATMMVVRASNIPRGTEDAVQRLLNKAHANIVGVVLNAVPENRVDSVHYHRHYYPSLYPSDGSTPPKALPAYNGNGTGNGNGAASPPDVPLALPGVAAPRPKAGVEEPASGDVKPLRGAVATVPHPAAAAEAAPGAMPDYVRQYARPVDAPKFTMAKLPWRMLAGVLAAGAVIGTLVLLLANGAKVH